MAGTVYVLGAGANHAIRDWDGLSPPLISNFFQVLWGHGGFKENAPLRQRLAPLYGYINRYWHKDEDALATTLFNLEDCFTLIDLQIREAHQQGDMDTRNSLWRIQFSLKAIFAQLLADFEHAGTGESWKARWALGNLLYKERPTIISFNYDCCTEVALEMASGVRLEGHPTHPFHDQALTGSELAYSHYNWNRPLGYGQRFDSVEIQQAGIPPFVDGDSFYSVNENQLYPWSLLKLHGSVNWFRYLNIRKYPAFTSQDAELPSANLAQVLLKRGHWWQGEPPDLNGWMLDPILITPVLYKEFQFSDPLYRRFLNPLWDTARRALASCEKLVVIGYSFASTDFHVHKLFLEAFASHSPDELVIVNPDTAVVGKVKELSNHHGPVVVFGGVEEFLSSEPGPYSSHDSAVPTESEGVPETTPAGGDEKLRLMVKCKQCGHVHPSSIQMNQQSFKTSTLIGNAESCPQCGAPSSYDKPDYFFR